MKKSCRTCHLLTATIIYKLQHSDEMRAFVKMISVSTAVKRVAMLMQLLC